jgi:hypothetical protein
MCGHGPRVLMGAINEGGPLVQCACRGATLFDMCCLGEESPGCALTRLACAMFSGHFSYMVVLTQRERTHTISGWMVVAARPNVSRLGATEC